MRLPLAPLAPLDAPPAAAVVEVEAPSRPVELPRPERSTSPAPAARTALDSLTLELIEEAPRVPDVAAPAAVSPAPVAAPVAAAPRAARPHALRSVLVGLASAAVLAAVVLAPKLRVRLAAPARQLDGTPAPAPTNFDAWREGAGGNWLI